MAPYDGGHARTSWPGTTRPASAPADEWAHISSLPRPRRLQHHFEASADRHPGAVAVLAMLGCL